MTQVKTTIDIASNTLRRSKELARRENLTLRELVEQGLELVLAEHEKRRRMQIKPVTFRGRGLAPEFRRARRSKIRDAAYEGRA